jgi:sRNA-binding regulator protein Hfq
MAPGVRPARQRRSKVNRKLIRTTLAEIRERSERDVSQQRSRPDVGAGAGAQRKRVPPEQTNAEAFYYKKQMDNRTPMVIVLQDGEELRGVIEWYDRSCVKLNRTGAPNLLVLKHNIKYMHKDESLLDEDESEVDDGVVIDEEQD